ncbi:hypothetical protein [Microbispora bryophytorum]|uniref:hypothetical protein n=1 Tax=Microbispora bryophytorum TaxID=1460882 RepID=UPI0034090772
MRDALLTLLAGLAAAAAGLWAWRHLQLIVGFPLMAVTIWATWRKVALGCSLTKKRQRWWLTTLPGAIASTGIVKVRRRVHPVRTTVVGPGDHAGRERDPAG